MVSTGPHLSPAHRIQARRTVARTSSRAAPAPQSGAQQTIDVSGGSGGIDAGSKRYELSAYLGGYSVQGDEAAVVATFEDANGRPLGSATIGPVTQIARHDKTSLVLSRAVGCPQGDPEGHDQIGCVRVAGNYNDGYADDISLTIN